MTQVIGAEVDQQSDRFVSLLGTWNPKIWGKLMYDCLIGYE